MTATVLTGDTSATGFSGSATYIEGDAAFTVDHAGGGTIDWSYVAATNSLTISDTNGTSASSAITITSHEGSNFSIDSIASDGVVGSLTTNVDIGQITFSAATTTGSTTSRSTTARAPSAPSPTSATWRSVAPSPSTPTSARSRWAPGWTSTPAHS